MTQLESDFLNWKDELLNQINSQDSTVAMGDAFVQHVLRYHYQLSEDDSVNATDMAGAGDHGIDGLIIEPVEDGIPQHGTVVQGKYGGAGEQLSPLQEFSKFLNGLKLTREGQQITEALTQCCSVLDAGGSFSYIIATVDPLTENQSNELQHARMIGTQLFGSSMSLEAISLRDLYEKIADQKSPSIGVSLACRGVRIDNETYIGAATLVDVYHSLREYAKQHNGVLDGIYDRNVRKWLGKRAKSVNAGIASTLSVSPEKFVAYNNGISLVCRSFESSDGSLQIDSPQIVNGCQTTRTLYEFMENHFPGQETQLDNLGKAEPYRNAFLTFKLTEVKDLDTDFVRDITRYSNRQNAVRGRDFLTLEQEFHRLKDSLLTEGYYLEIQTGEYNVLPKSEKLKFSEDTLINAFDALRFYGAAVLRKPHTAFGRSGDFTPGGNEFDDAMKNLSEHDLLVPWLMARHAKERGYSIGSKKSLVQNDHRNQTRYFYLYILFRVASQVITGRPDIEGTDRLDFYKKLMKLRQESLSIESGDTVFEDILEVADTVVAAHMKMADLLNWFTDRNAFLKGQDLLNQEHLVQASAQFLVKEEELKLKVSETLKSQL